MEKTKQRNPARVRSKWPEPTIDPPTLEEIEQWLWEDGVALATDGCRVEPDGRCPHGHPSWLIRLGLI